MPEELEQRGPDEGSEQSGGVREAGDAAKEAAREAAAEQAAASAKQAMQRSRKEEGKARRGDTNLARAFVHFLQNQTDSQYLELLISLLDRNVPSSVLLAGVSLLDDEAAAASREGVELTPEHARKLYGAIETHYDELPLTVVDPIRLRQWILLLVIAVDGLDLEMRERLMSANRDADQWIREFFQATIIRFSESTTSQARVDAAALALRIQRTLDERPLPPAPA